MVKGVIVIQLQGNQLLFSFPNVHAEAKISISFQRTLRIPDDGSEVFAYLPHVPGINPYLLRVGDEIEGFVADKNGRLELILATGTTGRDGGERRRDKESRDGSSERICHPYPKR